MSLHPRLEADTLPICDTQHAHIRLMNDSRWPWVILIPVQAHIEELHDFTDSQRDSFMSEVNTVSRALQNLRQCKSINIAMLGNVVSQLHCHVISRDQDDINWPNPIWGYGSATPYKPHDESASDIVDTLKRILY